MIEQSLPSGRWVQEDDGSWRNAGPTDTTSPTGGTTTRRGTVVAAGGETTLNLGAVPVAGSEHVFKNGLLLTWGVGYTLSGSTLTLTALTASDRITFWYDAAGPAGTPVLS